MTGCPMAYPDVCQTCVYFGKCPPSQTVEKLEKLQTQFNELKHSWNGSQRRGSSQMAAGK